MKIAVTFGIWMISCFLELMAADNYSYANSPSPSDFEFSNFFELNEKHLNVTPIKRLQAKTYEECMVGCTVDERCISFNFAKIVNPDGLHWCEMLDTDPFNATLDWATFKDNANYQYFTSRQVGLA